MTKQTPYNTTSDTMNYDKEQTMDEEKSFEIIQEGVQKEFESQPHLVRRGLTEVSAMFDRTGKGYLDDTERALRRMDSTDRGYLGIDKVCVIFESLQAEQERSSQLLEALRTESKKSLNLKKGVIALSVFTILLALANVGTSFAISNLTKETSVSGNDLIIKGSNGVRVGTTPKVMIFEMDSVDEDRRRRLTADAGLICEQMHATIDADGVFVTERECSLQGLIKLDVAEDLYTNLQTINHVVLSCNGMKSTMYGGSVYPISGPAPGIVNMGVDYKTFPSTNGDVKYQATQIVVNPSVSAVNGAPPVPGDECKASYKVAMYCPVDPLPDGTQAECMVMSAFQPSKLTPSPTECVTSPVFCGPKPTEIPLIN